MEEYIKGYEGYLTTMKNYQKNTVSSYLSDIRLFSDYLSSRGINHPSMITSEVLIEFFQSLSNKSISSLHRIRSSISNFFKFLINFGVIQTNLCKDVRLESYHRSIPDVLTKDEVDRLLNAPDTSTVKGIRDKAILELLYATGLQISIILSLDESSYSRDFEYLRFQSKKRDRIIPLYQEAVDALNNYLVNSRPLLISDPTEKALFVNVFGNRLSRQGFFKILKYYQSDVRIQKNLSPQILRHSFAIHLLENGASMSMLKDVFDYSDINNTSIYSDYIRNKLDSSYLSFHPHAKEK